MQLPINICDIEFRLFSIPFRAEMVLLMTSARVADKFITVLSICIIPTNKNTSLIFNVKDELCEQPGRMPEQ